MPRALKFFLLVVVLLTPWVAGSARGATRANASLTCRDYSVSRSGYDQVFGSLVVTIELDASICFNGKTIKSASETCKIPYMDALTVSAEPCTHDYRYYAWAAVGPQRPKGAYYAQATFVMNSCPLPVKVTCIKHYNVTMALYVNARGEVVRDDGR